MSAFDYGRSVETARRLIDRFGKTVVLVQRTAIGPRNAPVYIPSSTPLRAVELEKELKDKDGTLTGSTSRKLLIAGSAAVVPQKADKIEIGTETVEVDFLKTLNPGDTVVLYQVYLVS